MNKLLLPHFFRSVGADCTACASEADFAAFEAASGLSLPPGAREIWAASNGFAIATRRDVLKVMALSECLGYLQSMRQLGIPQGWGYVPFADLNDSNPFCICCNEPMRGYVVRVHHDDSAEIVYRGLDSFLDAVRIACETPDDGKLRFHDLPHDFDDHHPQRTQKDVETAFALLGRLEQLDEDVEQADALRWAIALLDGANVAEIVRLLDSGDEYCRKAAMTRLKAMKTPAAEEARLRHQREWRDFLNRCAEALRAAGLEVAQVTDASIRLGPRVTWLNMDMFFTRRHSPTFTADFVRRAKELVAMK